MWHALLFLWSAGTPGEAEPSCPAERQPCQWLELARLDPCFGVAGIFRAAHTNGGAAQVWVFALTRFRPQFPSKQAVEQTRQLRCGN